MKKKIKERDIVAGCKADKPQSQRQLYDLYCRMVMGMALRYTRNLTDAEDVVQETFIKIFMKIGSLRDEKSLTSWIKTITTNTCLDFLKSKNNDYIITSIEETDEDIKDEYHKNYDDIPTQQLLAFVQELPDGYRTVFNLFVFEKKPHREIAGLLGIKEDSSASQYFRARALLARQIKKYLKEHEG